MIRSCEECETQENLIFCTGCNDYFCEKHWDKPRKHRNNALGPGGIPHEKVDPEIAEFVSGCMAEPPDDIDQNKQHQDDEDTTWFGLARDAGGDPVLAEYRRYAALMMGTAQISGEERCPALVSFIGQTGAGKSSIIRLLINPTSHNNEKQAISAPVVGRSTSEVPTSADVHLYADPVTANSNRPILFADCEGFEGGERDPIATTAVPVDEKPESPGEHPPTATPWQKLARGTKRALKWANKDSPDHEKTSKRGYAVSQMYPRIFYAFSDVVVFVLQNQRTLEDVVEKLLTWADMNYTKSTNLPTLPHAIIALNKSDHLTPDDQWDPVKATANLLKSASAQINKNSTFKKYAEIWKSANVRIRDMEDLLRCYYSTVKVVRLPDKSRFQRMHDQRSELYELIIQCCEDTKEIKRERKMLPNVDEFGLYLSLAFDHFSDSLDKPFDYVEASLKHQPPPESLGAHMCTFVRLVAQQRANCTIGALFDELTPFIASCLLLDSTRKQRIGQASDWFTSSESRSDRKSAGDSYEKLCNGVLMWYFDFFVPCQFRIPHHANPIKTYACGQRRKVHHTTHRSYIGHHIYSGPFTNSFSPSKFSWGTRILNCLQELENTLSWHDPIKPGKARAEAHAHSMAKFYETLKPTLFKSNNICLSCLANPPEHKLPCGHMICTECLRDFGDIDTKSQAVIEQCPMHKGAFKHAGVPKACVISMDPRFSAKRVLVLDGGGARGIVEICVLQALQDRLGVSLQSFFDLVVGTSTGGIIALAFGDSMLDLKECSKKFIALVAQAFTLRKGQGYKLVRYVQIFVKRSKYQTRPLMRALWDVFGSQPDLLRARYDDSPQRLKVAVTATSSSGSKAYVLSNYNAKNGKSSSADEDGIRPDYIRYRSIDPTNELRVWEAGRCTSAAPGYFKPFARPSDEANNIFPELVDGGLLHNNPVEIALEESKRLAATAQQMPDPDILFSIGTGKPSDKPFAEVASAIVPSEPIPSSKGWVANLFTTISYQIQLNVDTERRFNQVLKQHSNLANRMYRINPDVGGHPPSLDDYEAIPRIQQAARGWLEDDKIKKYITRIACVLVSSSFYFERTSSADLTSASWIQLCGVIKCRLADDPQAVKGLGRFLDACDNEVTLVVENDPPDGAKHKQRFPVPVRSMVDSGVWIGMDVRMLVPGEETTTNLVFDMQGLCKERRFPLSGFPRNLMRVDFGGKSVV